MEQNELVEWLLAGDPSVRWQVQRDLLGADEPVYTAERSRVAISGWGARLLSEQAPDGTWGGGLYSPKWISTTYTLLTLRFLGLEPGHPRALQGCQCLLEGGYYRDGGINFSASYAYSETCITGMVLSILAYFGFSDPRLHDLTAHLLHQQMADGGWNCQSYKGATHSSFHTTISVLEGLFWYAHTFPDQGQEAVLASERGREFLLQHQLYRSSRTGKVVHPALTRFPFPPRWHFDVLRGLDYFQRAGAPANARLRDPIALLARKRCAHGAWNQYRGPSGREYFQIEQAGKPGRMNTLRALRVLRWWNESTSPVAG